MEAKLPKMDQCMKKFYKKQSAFDYNRCNVSADIGRLCLINLKR